MMREEKIFEMAKIIAPIFVKKGLELQEHLIRNGNNPEECTIEDKSIPEAYAESLKKWATVFTEVLIK